jgi:hypothetical protein
MEEKRGRGLDRRSNRASAALQHAFGASNSPENAKVPP